jgi:hypothetical protein
MYGEMPSVYRESFPKARKEHTCYECRRSINKGQTYHYAEGCWVGKFSRYKTCKPCDDLRHELRYEGEYASFGQLEDWANDADVKFPPDC